jgi:hypothetical protein
MSDPTEIAALKASFRGALSTAQTLAAWSERIDALSGDVSASDLEELQRITAAHALASAALRGLVDTMIARRTENAE